MYNLSKQEKQARNGDVQVGRDYINRNYLEIKYNPIYSDLKHKLIDTNTSYSDDLRKSSCNISYAPSVLNSDHMNTTQPYSQKYGYCLSDEEIVSRDLSFQKDNDKMDMEYALAGIPAVSKRFIDLHFQEIVDNPKFSQLKDALMEQNDTFLKKVQDYNRSNQKYKSMKFY